MAKKKVKKKDTKTYDFTDGVNHPDYYNFGNIEVIEYIEDQGFGEGFCKGNALKYISRAGKKDIESEIKDLEKAVWYTRRMIEYRLAQLEGRQLVRPNDMPKEMYNGKVAKKHIHKSATKKKKSKSTKNNKRRNR